jgi:type II secretory pathway pseudopilin PulG
MSLRGGQGLRTGRRGGLLPSPYGGFGATGGYAMAALLVALAVMSVLMSMALPVWRHDAQREKEEELVFRGQQYVRAIRLFQTKNQTLPTSVDILVQGHYLRKKYKDPITNDEFIPIGPGTALPGQNPSVPGAQRGGQPGSAGQPGSTGSSSIRPGPTSSAPTSSMGGMVAGGMMGVVSKSKEESIRLYQGRNHYNEWTFLFVNQAPAGGQGGSGLPGGPGGQPFPGRGGTGPGGRGPGTSPFAVPGGSGFPGGGRGAGPGGRGVGPGGQPLPPGRGRQ